MSKHAWPILVIYLLQAFLVEGVAGAIICQPPKQTAPSSPCKTTPTPSPKPASTPSLVNCLSKCTTTTTSSSKATAAATAAAQADYKTQMAALISGLKFVDSPEGK